MSVRRGRNLVSLTYVRRRRTGCQLSYNATAQTEIPPLGNTMTSTLDLKSHLEIPNLQFENVRKSILKVLKYL